MDKISGNGDLGLVGKILDEAGFWDCLYVFPGDEISTSGILKKDALKELPKVINKYHELGKPVSLPNRYLFQSLEKISDNEGENKLSDTFFASSLVVAMHIKHAESSPQTKKKAYRELRSYFDKTF